MASVVLGALGQYIGGALGGGLTQSLLGYVGSMAGYYIDSQYLFPPDDIKIEGPRLEELHVQTSAYGRPLPVVFGRIRVPGGVIWSRDIVESEETEDIDGGGGLCGGGSSSTITTYSYSVDVSLAMCKGPIAYITKVWGNKKLLWDIEHLLNPDIVWVAQRIPLFHFGTEAQLPDLYMSFYEGIGTVPAHRGMAYITFSDFQLEHFGNMIPNFEFEVCTSFDITPGRDTITGWNALDHRVFNNIQSHVIAELADTWTRLNNFTLEIEVTEDLSASNIPYNCNFDIDERGYIYTDKYGSGTDSYFYKMDSVNFTEVFSSENADVAAGENRYRTNPDSVAVCKNSMHPWVAYCRNGGGIDITHRDTFLSPDMLEVSFYSAPPTGTVAKWACFDHTDGDLYVLFSDSSVPSAGALTYIRKYDCMAMSYTEWDISALVYGGRRMDYDPASDQVLVLGFGQSSYLDVNGIVFLDASDMTSNGFLSGNVSNTSNDTDVWQYGARDGFLWTLYGTTTVNKINIYDRTIEQSWTIAGAGAQQAILYDVFGHAVYVSRSAVSDTKDYLDRGTVNSEPLENVVTDICAEAGLMAGDIDVTALAADDVRGYCLNRRMTVRSALTPLMAAYFFDAVESDSKIKFIKRGGASVVAILEDDLACHPEGMERPQTMIITRQQESELPRQVNVDFMDPAREQEINTQMARRQVGDTEDMRSLALPLVLSASEAKQIAERTLYMLWVNRIRFKFYLSPEYLYLEAGDVITVTEGGNTHTIRIEGLNFSNGVIEVTGVSEDNSVYASDATGDTGDGFYDGGLSFQGPMEYQVLDLPMLYDTHDYAGLYVAGSGYLSGWTGGNFYRSSDGGATWQVCTSIHSSAVLGTATGALSDYAHSNFDKGNEVTIRLHETSESLTSATEAEVLSGANACLLGDEILQFEDVTDHGDGTWTIKTMLRGRRGTEWAKGSHVAGDRFVLLEDTPIQFFQMDLNLHLTTMLMRGISFNMPASSSYNTEVTIKFRTLMPYSPVHIAGTRDGSDNLTVTWIRRTRRGGAWADGYDVPLAENSEEYEVDIMSGSTVLRTIEVTAETASYTAAQQTTDGLTPGDPVEVNVYQLNDEVGRGFAGNATI